ncbi:MAG TPA: hypothetical protein P5191_06115 [Ruminococcus sp.]|nr:hypothetical protein [Ruminococcus sp.]
MDRAIIISAAIMVVITGTEFFCLFLCSKFKMNNYPIAALVPVFSSDDELAERLEYIMFLTERGSSPIEHIILMDINGSDEQISYCRMFCQSCKIAELITDTGIAKKMSEIFAFQTKT